MVGGKEMTTLRHEWSLPPEMTKEQRTILRQRVNLEWLQRPVLLRPGDTLALFDDVLPDGRVIRGFARVKAESNPQ